ncbi:hypothetical protein R3P38DRAFT_2496144 [Favolaschia claudopus]|uniref:Uncharacterized protein n=1 Tax=Favolaschia claudopus TaxID=2862362 RepID=A0AAW0E1S2_9AGAR
MRNYRRYQPYPPPATSGPPLPPAPSPETKQMLKTALEQLTFFNGAGTMVTWDGGDWKLIARPTRKTGGRSTLYVGAASFPKVPGFRNPQCPDLDAYGRPYAPMDLHPGKTLDGVKQDFFRATDHQCMFVDEQFVEKSLTPTSPNSTPSSSSSSPNHTNSDCISKLLRGDPRIPACYQGPPSPEGSVAASSPSRPTPTPRWRTKYPKHASMYSEVVFKARGHSDESLLNQIWDGYIAGQYEISPSSHPAYPNTRTITPRVLRPYDPDFYPSCLDRTYQELRFLGTDIGRAVRALNSTFGITPEVLAEIKRDCVTCSVCRCQFSHEGFNHHIRDGLCESSPTPSPVATLPTIVRLPHELSLRELPSGKQLGKFAEYLDFPIGAAFLQWNSRLGVPRDVWALVSTATIECETCAHCRVFPAHLAHLHPVTGICNDLVDEP